MSVSAPSKVILHGEHAVVYGKTAVAASLGLRTSMTIKPGLGKVVVDFPDLGLQDSWPVERLQELFLSCPPDSSEVCPAYLERLHEFLGTDPSNLRMAGVLCFLYLYTVILHPDPVPMEIRVSSEIPLGAGLGSSAALSVCLAAGLTSVVRQVRRQEGGEDAVEVCRLALLSEKILHGNPSGIDNSVSTYGGLCQFSGGLLTTLPSPRTRLLVMLVNTRVPRDTKALVAKVRASYEKYPRIIRPILEAMDGVSKAFLGLLAAEGEEVEAEEADTMATMEQLVATNQALLEALGVSHPALQQVISVLQTFGLSAKLTGAGGGGFALALVPPTCPARTIVEATEALEDRGYDVTTTRLGGQGYSLSIAS